MARLRQVLAMVAGPARRSHTIRIAFAVFVSIGVVVAAVLLGDVGRYAEAVASMRVAPLLGVAALLAACNGLRVWRLSLTVPEAPVLGLGRAAMLHQFMVAVVPAKLGELVLPVMLSRSGHLPLGQAFGVLLYIRLLDLAGLLVAAALSVMLVGAALDDRAPWIALAALVVIVGAAGAASVTALALHRAQAGRSRIVGLARTIVAPAAGLGRSTNLRIALLSLAIWFVLLSAFHLACVSLGVGASYAEVVVSATLGNLLAALPVNGIGGIGASQLSWAGMLAGFGREFEAAFVAGVAIQAMAVLVSGVGAVLLSFLDLVMSGGGDGRR